MTDLTTLTIAQVRQELRKKTFSTLELVDAYIKNMHRHRHLNCYITETLDLAREQAKRADRRLRQQTSRLLEGVPIAHKDLLCTKGVRTTAGAKILEDFIPPYESTVSKRLQQEGAISLGKLNLDQFGMGSTTTTSYFGPTKNPWKKTVVCGGSSGGSAVAVASDMAIAATATDTGGSIRQPAAFCGVSGIKPTYGRCSRYGIIAYASSLDQCGVIAKDVRDCAIMLQVMCGFDHRDSTSLDKPVPQFSTLLREGAKGVRVGIPKEYTVDGISKDVEDVWQKGIRILQRQGAKIVEVSLPHTSYALPSYYIIACAESSSNLARYDGVRYGLRIAGENLIDMYAKTRACGFGSEVKRRILMGTFVLSEGFFDAYYQKAQRVRTLVAQDFMESFKMVDVLLTPVTKGEAFVAGDDDDPVKMYLNDLFTVPVNLAGLPALSIPIGLSSQDLPLGLQIIGKPFEEQSVLDVAYTLERNVNFSAKPKV